MNQSKINPHRGVVLPRPVSKKTTNQGITLISLVVTIIILLILAGVTLALISGSDGILDRASHALDENKIAMAKEQVELALSDFQTEFFEEKYVERTNNGNKKEYISEKLQIGVGTTNFYAQASEEGKVTVYEGKDTSGTQVIKGTIQDDASIKWDDVKIGNSAGNGGSAEGGNGEGSEEESGDSTGSGNINSEELATLKSQISQLQGEVNTLKIQQQTTNNALDVTQKGLEITNSELENTNKILDSILTSQTRKDVIYSGTASQRDRTYQFTFPSGKTLTSYKMLIFFADAHFISSNSWITKQTVMAYPEVRNEKFVYSFNYSNYIDEKNHWSLFFSTPNTSSFRIDTFVMGAYIDVVRIYQVIGVY